jgi:hypothetical protein
MKTFTARGKVVKIRFLVVTGKLDGYNFRSKYHHIAK